MTRPWIPIVCLLVLMTAAPCRAGVVLSTPIDLGADEVTISPMNRLQQDFAGTQAWPEINTVQVRLAGRHSCQFAYCAEHTTPMPGPVIGAIAFGFMVGETEVFRTTRSFPCVLDGADFDVTLDFRDGPSPDWSFLADGTGTFFVEHSPGPSECVYWPVYVGTDAVLTGIELLVDLPSEVPAERPTWGTFKARYR